MCAYLLKYMLIHLLLLYSRLQACGNLLICLPSTQGFISLHMAQSGYLWLHLSTYSSIFTYGYISVTFAPSSTQDSIWLHYGSICLPIAPYMYVYLLLTLRTYGSICLGLLWLHLSYLLMAKSVYIWIHLSTYDSICAPIAISVYLYLQLHTQGAVCLPVASSVYR